MLAGGRADVDDPVGVPDHVSSCSTTNSELPDALSGRARAAAPRCRPGAGPRTARRARRRRRTGSSGPASPAAAAAARRARASACCARARGSRGRGRAARAEPRATRSSAIRCGDHAPSPGASRARSFAQRAARRRRRAYGLQAAAARAACSGSGATASAMSRPANVTDSASRRSRLPWQSGQSALTMYCDDALLHQRALRVGERVQHVAPRAGEGAHVARLLLALAAPRRVSAGVKPA